jgi:hypothetical protein
MTGESDPDGILTFSDRLTPPVADHSGYCLRNRDVAFLRLEASQIVDWRARRAPLGLSPREWDGLRGELALALQRDDVPIGACDIRLQGSSGAFFSGAHKPMPRTRDEVIDLYRELRDEVPADWEADEIMERLLVRWISDDDFPGQRPFDSMHRLRIAEEPSDLDLQISSDVLTSRCEQVLIDLGQNPTTLRQRHPTYDFVRTDLVAEAFPRLYLFGLRMYRRLGRHVSIAVFPSVGPRDVSAQSPNLSSHFKDDDWLVQLGDDP